jgi:hypothetical protein
MISGEGEPVGVGNKKWWGPRIWRILHSLAEISDRADCGPAWRVTLSATAEMLPCAMCRNHFHSHIRGLSLPVGRIPRDTLRHLFWVAHAGTGGILPEAELSTEYGCGGNRTEVLRIATGLIEEVFTGLRDGGVYDRFTAGRITTWHRAITALATLLQTPLPEAPARGRRTIPPPRSARGTGNRRRM